MSGKKNAATKTVAELLREIAAADPDAHNTALACGYGCGPAPALLLDAKHDDPDPTGELIDFGPVAAPTEEPTNA